MTSPGIRKSFGKYLRGLRDRQNLGLRELSKRVSQRPGARGLSPAYLSLIERGLVEIPQQHVLCHLSAVLGVDEDQFGAIAKGQQVIMLSELFSQSSTYQIILADLRNGTARYPAILSAITDLLQKLPRDFQGLRSISFREGASDGFLSLAPPHKRRHPSSQI